MSRIEGPARPQIDNAVLHEGRPRFPKVHYGLNAKRRLVVAEVYCWDHTPFYNMLTGKGGGEHGVILHQAQTDEAQRLLRILQRGDRLKELWRKTAQAIGNLIGMDVPPAVAAAPRSPWAVVKDQQRVVNAHMMSVHERYRP